MRRILLALCVATSLPAQNKLSTQASGDTTVGWTIGRFKVTDSLVVSARAWLTSLMGTATNDNAVAGAVGEEMSHTTAAGGVSLVTNTTKNVDSLTLTAGDWEVSGVVGFRFAATTSYTNITGGISTTTATLGALGSYFDHETPAQAPTATKDPVWVVPHVRMSLAASTKVYLVAQGTFTVSTLSAFGVIRARRTR